MAQQRSDHGDDSTMNYCFWATVKLLTIHSALMPPNKVYQSFSRKKCIINPCCISVCRTENVMWVTCHNNDNLRVHQTIYPLEEEPAHVLWPETLKDIIFKILMKKKIGEWFHCWETWWLPKNADFMRITLLLILSPPPNKSFVTPLPSIDVSIQKNCGQFSFSST